MKLPSLKTRIALLLTALVAAAVLAPRLGSILLDLANWIEGLGTWGVVFFVVLYAAVTVVLIPASILTFAGGAIFGLGKGFALVVIGAFIGALISFCLARTIAHDAVQRMLANRPAVQSIERAVSHQGRRVVFLLRLSPVIPFGLANFALGLTSIRFRDYLFGHLGTIPGSLLYTYYGAALGSLAALASGQEMPRGKEYWLFMSLGLIATLAASWQVTQIARRALAKENIDLNDGLLNSDSHPESENEA